MVSFAEEAGLSLVPRDFRNAKVSKVSKAPPLLVNSPNAWLRLRLLGLFFMILLD